MGYDSDKRVVGHYYVDMDEGGLCCIVKARRADEARRMIKKEHGRSANARVRPAFQSDLDWVLAMGGRVLDS